MECDFEIIKLSDNEYLHKCKNIGCTKNNFIHSSSGIHRMCNGISSEQPITTTREDNKTIIKTSFRLASMAARLASATAKWIAAGSPIREKEEIDNIFATYCSVCEHFNKENSSCNRCGCRCKEDNGEFLNKIRMATEHCPIQKW